MLERRSREYVLGRIRAGVLEQGTVALLEEAGVAERLHREGLVHSGIEIAFGGVRHRIDFAALVGGAVTVYGQTEITRDLMDALAADGVEPRYEAEAIEHFAASTARTRRSPTARTASSARSPANSSPAATAITASAAPLSRPPPSPPTSAHYAFGWLGVLSETPPVSDELIYANSERGFALCSMRSHSLSRYYVQVPLETKVEDWPDERFFDELRRRLDPAAAESLIAGPAIEKSIAPLRSFVAEPMRFGRLFLAGDAAHIVPPTGAKGLNLAAADVRYLAHAFIEHYREKSSAGLESYSERCLRRVWKAERFSWWMTSLLHILPETGPFGRRIQLAELDYLVGSRAASTALAENYVGLPFDERAPRHPRVPVRAVSK